MQKKVVRFFASLKLAVVTILALAIALAAATFLESLYDTPTAQYFVYRSSWFHALLALFGVNIFSVAMSRLPWKWRHTSFLLAHLGILILLVGSWVTDRYGIDATLRISEGETASAIEFENASLILSEKTKVESLPVPWQPPSVKFKPVSVSATELPFRLTVDQYLSHADADITFVPDTASVPIAAPALHLKMVGGPMGISQDLWVWAGDPNWAKIQAGPSSLSIGARPAPTAGRPQLAFTPQPDGSLKYWAKGSDEHVVEGNLKSNEIVGKLLEPGWKGGVHVTLLDWIPHAVSHTNYKLSRMLYGKEAPPSAIHVKAVPFGPGMESIGPTEVWLGMGDRATLHLEKQEMDIGYFPRRSILPFSIKLDRFSVEHYEGTVDPSSYASRVTVIDQGGQKPVTISMNEPLDHQGYTLYQASYEDGQPRPVTSIFAINRDPGRIWKYLGSLLIVIGTFMLFAMKYWNKKKAPKIQTKIVPEAVRV